jgi:hypothetical protein
VREELAGPFDLVFLSVMIGHLSRTDIRRAKVRLDLWKVQFIDIDNRIAHFLRCRK